MRKKDKKKYMQIAIVTAIVLLAIVVLIVGLKGGFKFLITVNLPNASQENLQPKTNVQEYFSCSQLCSARGFSKFYTFINSCKPGETKLTYGFPNQPPLLSCCCYNEAIIPVHTCTDTDGGRNKDIPGTVTYDGVVIGMDRCDDATTVYEYQCFADGTWGAGRMSCDPGQICISTRSGGHCVTSTPSYNVGDIVYDSGNIGNDLLAGNPGFSQLIDLSNIPPTNELGGCKLQARIQTDWGYITPGTCSGLQGMEGMYFSFYDSSGKVWEKTETQPVALGSLTKCGLRWDGTNLWSFNYNKLLNLPQCSMGLDYKIEIVVCEC